MLINSLVCWFNTSAWVYCWETWSVFIVWPMELLYWCICTLLSIPPTAPLILSACKRLKLIWYGAPKISSVVSIIIIIKCPRPQSVSDCKFAACTNWTGVDWPCLWILLFQIMIREAFDRLDLYRLTLFVDVAISDHDRRNGAYQTSMYKLDLCGLTLFVDVAISDHDRRNGAFQTSMYKQDLCGLTLFVDVAISDHDRRNGAFQTSIWQPAALHLLWRCHHATGRLPLPLPRPLFLWLHQQQIAGERGVFCLFSAMKTGGAASETG